LNQDGCRHGRSGISSPRKAELQSPSLVFCSRHPLWTLPLHLNRLHAPGGGDPTFIARTFIVSTFGATCFSRLPRGCRVAGLLGEFSCQGILDDCSHAAKSHSVGTARPRNGTQHGHQKSVVVCSSRQQSQQPATARVKARWVPVPGVESWSPSGVQTAKMAFWSPLASKPRTAKSFVSGGSDCN
jgi:hypothetical protein